MTTDIARLESASALRTWEEGRAKSYTSWQDAVRALMSGIKSTVDLGLARHNQLERVLKRRSAADKAYAQALAEVATSPFESGVSEQPLPPKQGGTAADAAAAAAAHANAAAEAAAALAFSPLVAAIAELQKVVSHARQSFATEVLDNAMLTGMTATAVEFEKTSTTMLQGLDAGLVEVEQAHLETVETMAVFHRASLNTSVSSASGPPKDMWLEEHRYRRAVANLRTKQRSFNCKVCNATEEVWRLEEWREEMSRKILSKFCTKLHQVETTVQSVANDGIKELAGHRPTDVSERGVLSSLERVLRSVPPPGPGQVPFTAETKGKYKWPALRRVRALGKLHGLPQSVMARAGGPLQAPGRWYGKNSCIVVLTKDDWLHCFNVSEKKVATSVKSTTKAADASTSSSSVPAGSSDEDGNPMAARLDAVDAEPQWSMHVPLCTISAVSGKPKCFEIEEKKKTRFLSLGGSHKELLQADNDAEALRWIHALKETRTRHEACGEAQADSVQPPPPPPPPTAAEPVGTEVVEPANGSTRVVTAPTPPQDVPPEGRDTDAVAANTKVPKQKPRSESISAEHVFL